MIFLRLWWKYTVSICTLLPTLHSIFLSKKCFQTQVKRLVILPYNLFLQNHLCSNYSLDIKIALFWSSEFLLSMTIKLVWKWKPRGFFYSGVKPLEQCTSTRGKRYQLYSQGNKCTVLNCRFFFYFKWRNVQAPPKGQMEKKTQIRNKDSVCAKKPPLILPTIWHF